MFKRDLGSPVEYYSEPRDIVSTDVRKAKGENPHRVVNETVSPNRFRVRVLYTNREGFEEESDRPGEKTREFTETERAKAYFEQLARASLERVKENPY